MLSVISFVLVLCWVIRTFLQVIIMDILKWLYLNSFFSVCSYGFYYFLFFRTWDIWINKSVESNWTNNINVGLDISISMFQFRIKATEHLNACWIDESMQSRRKVLFSIRGCPEFIYIVVVLNLFSERHTTESQNTFSHPLEKCVPTYLLENYIYCETIYCRIDTHIYIDMQLK